jgi:hypothetical protein
MNIHKVDLVLKYILAAAGQEDFGNQEVGPIHLVKYIWPIWLLTKGLEEKLLLDLSDSSSTIILTAFPSLT